MLAGENFPEITQITLILCRLSYHICSVDTEKCQELDLFLLQGSICNQIYTFLVYTARAFGSSSLEQGHPTLTITSKLSRFLGQDD